MKYPFEIASSIASIKGENKTLSVEAHFTRRTDDKPMQIFDDNFSRFKMTVLSGGKAAYCNIPIDEVAAISKKTDYAMNKHLDGMYATPASPEENSPAYTERFASGNLKGKSPADVLRENGEKGKEILNKQYSFLKENLGKYPKNQVLMDAILAAAKLNLEDIKETTSVSVRPISIVDIGCRPLIRKKREDGMCFCYEAYVTWDTSKTYPVNIRLINYYAPVETRENGSLNVQISKKDESSKIENEFNMTADGWLHIVEEMQIKRSGFEYIYLKNAIELAEKADAENREEARKHEENNA